jgi:hypothetical protein
LHANLVALCNLAFELLPPHLTPLGEGHVQGLGANHLVVHLRNGLGSFVRRGEANETKALGSALFIAHDLTARDRAEWLELGTELVIVDVVL